MAIRFLIGSILVLKVFRTTWKLSVSVDLGDKMRRKKTEMRGNRLPCEMKWNNVYFYTKFDLLKGGYIVMSMIEEVRSQMMEAMKKRDKDRKDALSMLLSALKNKAIDKREDLTEAEEFEVVKKEIKQTKETMELAPEDRADIKEACQIRLAVYQEFAPEEMSEEAIREQVKEVLAALGITELSGKDKGKVMKELMPKVKGKADGGLVNQIVGEMLG